MMSPSVANVGNVPNPTDHTSTKERATSGHRNDMRARSNLHARRTTSQTKRGNREAKRRCPIAKVKPEEQAEYVTEVAGSDPVQDEIRKLQEINAKLKDVIGKLDETISGTKDGPEFEHASEVPTREVLRARLEAQPPEGTCPPEPQAAVETKERTLIEDHANQPSSSADEDRKKALDRLSQSPGTGAVRTNMNIVFVSSEAAPWSKTGGLGDVVGSLPSALASRGHRVMVVVPRYINSVTDALYDDAQETDCKVSIDMGYVCGRHEVGYFHLRKDNVDWVFVDHPVFQRTGSPYGDEAGAFGDNQFRFTLLSLAGCEAPLNLELQGSVYGEKCVFVANDWHAGMVPVYLAAKYRPYGVYRDARSILCIHNLSHQGVEPAMTYGNFGLPGEWYGALEWVFPEWARAHELDKGEAVNILKGATVTADRLMTVSQGYAWEITTPEGGWGLDHLLRSRQHVLNGVTNGVDYTEWDPETDKLIEKTFSFTDLSGKASCKEALQKQLGLPCRPNAPLICFIGRLDHQKGPDLVRDSLAEMVGMDAQIIMLGSGDLEIERWMRWAETAYPDSFRGWVGFSVPTAHQLIAGADILLMPSRFEPCGLNQLYAMRYGTVPVAHSTGGLRDTIDDFNPFAKGKLGTGTGWTFSPAEKWAMLGALEIAVDTYRHHKESWAGIQQRGMTQDFTWGHSAEQYEQIFEWALMDPPYA
mmetsp:Transcript_3620/g.22666  ORF Transcript_3620/g.22666 Transcript_3620/m.22666 type:complete len:703 (+) Transcript_3620:3-2111(+)